MWTRLFTIDGPWPGSLAISARPRGSDWLEDDLGEWRNAGVCSVVSLLTADEEQDLDLKGEAETVKQLGMEFISFPIADRQVPNSQAAIVDALEKISSGLSAGKNTVIHCRQGIGRSGLVAACLLISSGVDPSAAVDRISAARGLPIPETDEQRRWIDRYAASLASAKS